MNKKGFLFTIISLIVLISILVFVIAYNNRVKQLNELDTVNILRYYEDDIVSNVYAYSLDINLVNISNGGNTLINFSKLGLYSGNRNQQGIMDNYRTFVIGDYSKLNNINVSFDNFVPEFFIRPYNSKFTLANKNLTVLNPNYSQIQRINIDITVNETLDTDDNNKPKRDNNQIPIRVRFIRRSNGAILYDKEVEQNPTQNNELFQLTFKTNPPPIHDFSEVSVKFGNYGQNGMLIASVNNLEGEVTKFEIYYNNSNSRIILDADSNLKINDKETRIVLAQE